MREAISSPASTSSFTALAFAPGALKTGDAAKIHIFHRHVVGSGAGPAYRFYARGNIHLQHVVRTDQDRIRLGYIFADNIMTAVKKLEA